MYVGVCSYRAETDEDKSVLYFRLLAFYSVWFFILFVVVLLAFALDAVVREMLVTAFLLVISSLAYTSLAFLLWPSRAAQYFKIDVMAMADRKYDAMPSAESTL